jgi:RNA-splicing ligase RtcB
VEEFANIRNWASILDDATRDQAERTARLPILSGPLALMPDAHLGIGATIGTVIPTVSAVIPSAVGVDIGCGMAAVQLRLKGDAIEHPGVLELWVKRMQENVPAGLGHWDAEPSKAALRWLRANPPPATVVHPNRAAVQLGTLGSGNHFVEVARDQANEVWLLLHSGSRGAGNALAALHTRVAKKLHEGLGTRLEDPELAWLQENTPEFDAYIRDLRWSQSYAYENRRQLLARTVDALTAALGAESLVMTRKVNCHHNYTEREHVGGRDVWVTRKGAIRARVGDWGLIPGAMGQKSFVVRGLGNPLSYESCSHGAGRVMSRTRARKELVLADFKATMGGVAWQDREADALMDEAPRAYKDIDTVMRDQADLVEIVYTLKAVGNYKGVEHQRRRRKKT